MTTPADFSTIIPQLKDPEALGLLRRLVEAQRQSLDSQIAQLEEVHRALLEQERALGGQPGRQINAEDHITQDS